MKCEITDAQQVNIKQLNVLSEILQSKTNHKQRVSALETISVSDEIVQLRLWCYRCQLLLCRQLLLNF